MSHATEKYIMCPYNPAHIILSYRMNTHLVKCRKQHETLDWGRCSHNINHHMPRVELSHHENHECPNRHSFQASIVGFEAEEHKSLAPIEHIPVPESEENWDDGPVNCFDPKENARQKAVIRGLHCAPPAERKAFKAEHRRHLREREEDPTYEGVSKAKVKTEPMKPKDDAPLEPLRFPKELPKGFTLGRGQSVNASTSSTLASTAKQVNPGVDAGLQGAQWTGLGRGNIGSATAASAAAAAASLSSLSLSGERDGSLPPTNAWGRGRPRI